MSAALHGADFPKAQKIRQSMDTADLREFAQKVKASGGSESHSYDWRTRQNLKQNRGR